MPPNQLSFRDGGAPSLRVATAQESVIQAHDEDTWATVHALIELVVAARSRKVVAAELDIGPSQLTDALAGNGKQFQLRWLPALARITPHELKADFARVLAAMFEEDEPLTPEQELEELRAEVRAQLGAAGAAIVETVKRRRRRRGGSR